MSIEQTGRAARGAPRHPIDQPSPAPPGGAGEAAASAGPIAREFDARLRLGTDPASTTRSQSIVGRPRAPIPGAAGPAIPQMRREAPGEQMARLKASLIGYYQKDQASGPGRSARELRALAEPAYDQANELLGVCDSLKGPLRAKAASERVPGFAYQMRVSAAYQLASTLPADEELVRTISAGAIGGMPAEQMYAMLVEGLELADRKHAEASRYLPVLKAAMERYGTAKGIEEPGAQPCLQQAVAGLAEALHGQCHAAEMRMMFSVLHLGGIGASTDEFAVALHPFRQFTEERLARLQEICDLHQDARVALTAQERQWLAAHIEAMRSDAETVCLVGCRMAAEAIDGKEPAVAQSLLQFADSFRMVIASLEQIRDQPRLPQEVAARIPGQTRLGTPTERSEVLDEHRRAAAQALEEARGRQDGANSGPAPGRAASSSRARKHKPKPIASAAATPPAVPVEVSAVHELALDRLRQFPAPPVDAGGELDLVAMGEKLNRDTSVLRLFNERSDPLVVGRAMREAVRGWFGEPTAWQRTRRQLQAQSSQTDGRDALLDRIDQRLAGIDALIARIDVQELDTVKGYARPDESHVELLRTSGHIHSVSTLSLLPSDTDPDPARGTVFEAALHPTETSSGERAAPIFLHLHTHAPTTAQACSKLPLAQLAAAHFKSAAQRGLGANWERLHGAMGQVHRGRLNTPALLKDLQRRMA